MYYKSHWFKRVFLIVNFGFHFITIKPIKKLSTNNLQLKAILTIKCLNYF